MPAALQYFEPNAPNREVVEALEKDGACVVKKTRYLMKPPISTRKRSGTLWTTICTEVSVHTNSKTAAGM